MYQRFVIEFPEGSRQRIKYEIHQDEDNGIFQYVEAELRSYPFAVGEFGMRRFKFKRIDIIKHAFRETYNVKMKASCESAYKDLLTKFQEKGVFLIDQVAYSKKLSFASVKLKDIVAFIQVACEFEPILNVIYGKMGEYFGIDFNVPTTLNTWVAYAYQPRGYDRSISFKHTGKTSSVFDTIHLWRDFGDFQFRFNFVDSITIDRRAALITGHALPLSYEISDKKKYIFFESSDTKDIAIFIKLVANIEPSIRSCFQLIEHYLELEIDPLTHTIPHWVKLIRCTLNNHGADYSQRFMPQNTIERIRLERVDVDLQKDKELPYRIEVFSDFSENIYACLMQHSHERFENKLKQFGHHIRFEGYDGSGRLLTFFVYILMLFEPNLSLLLDQLSHFIGVDLQSPEAKAIFERFNVTPDVEKYLRLDSEDTVKEEMPKHETSNAIFSESDSESETEEEQSRCELM